MAANADDPSVPMALSGGSAGHLMAGSDSGLVGDGTRTLQASTLAGGAPLSFATALYGERNQLGSRAVYTPHLGQEAQVARAASAPSPVGPPVQLATAEFFPQEDSMLFEHMVRRRTSAGSLGPRNSRGA